MIFKFFILFWAIGVGQVWSKKVSEVSERNPYELLVRQYEASHGIPDNLLTTISLVESGRKVGRSVVAWSWSVNANGKPYIFETKKAAMGMTRKLQAHSITNIDVRCMKINLKQRPKAFQALEAVLDPETNTNYAARFLKAKQKNKGSWGYAVAHYHSATTRYHPLYRKKVLKVWRQNAEKTRSSPEPSL